MSKVYDNIKVVRSLDPDVRTTATTGEGSVDTKGFNDGMLVAVSGDITATTGDAYTVEVYEGDTTASFSATGIKVTFSNAESNTVKEVRIPNLNTTRKRYLRADLGGTATTYSFEGGSQIVLGEGVSNPVN